MKKSRVIWCCVLVGALAGHLALVFRSYPLSVLFRGDIPLKGDVFRYFATAWGSANVNGLFGYDPYFMAGYPVGLWNSMGRKGFEIFHLFFPWVPLPVLFYILIVSLCLASPLIVWFALKGFCPTRRSTFLLFVLLLVYWHLDTWIAYYWNFGNIFFPATSCLLPLASLCAWNVLNRRGIARSAVGLTLCASAIFYFHPLLLLAMGICLAACVSANLTAARHWQVWLTFVTAFVLFLLLAFPWLLPLLLNYQDYEPLPYGGGFLGTFKHLIMDTFSDRVYRHHFDRNFLLHLAVAFGCAGAWLFRKDRKTRLMTAMGLAALGCLVIAYSFSHISFLEQTQSYRFLTPATILFLGPIALFLDFAIKQIRQAGKSVQVSVGVLLVAVMPGFTAYMIDLARPPIACGTSQSQRSVFQVLESMPIRGRLLCDDIDLGHLIPYRCGIPVIGGLSAGAYVKHAYAGVQYDGALFGRLPQSWKTEKLRTYLATYAIDYALFSRREWIDLAEKPGSPFVFQEAFNGYQLFKVRNAQPGYVLKGSARVAADYGMIKVTDVNSTNLVLKFHYADWLEANNGVRLEAVSVLEDPVPFIRCVIPENVTDFRISKRH